MIKFLIRIYFLIEFLLRFFASKDRAKYLSSLESVVDILTIAPFFLAKLVF
jgi:hypothetical protein